MILVIKHNGNYITNGFINKKTRKKMKEIVEVILKAMDYVKENAKAIIIIVIIFAIITIIYGMSSCRGNLSIKGKTEYEYKKEGRCNIDSIK